MNMKKIGLLFSVSTILFFSCSNKEKEIVIVNTSNPKYNIGVWWTVDEKNANYTYINDIYSLWPNEIGKTMKDSLTHNTILKAFIVSKDSIVLSEFLERRYRNNVPHLTVFGNEINLNPYLRDGSCEYMRFLTPYSHNDLIFYTLNIIGKGSDNKYYSQPLTLMININTKECKVVGRGHYIDGPNMAIYDDMYLGILDYYMDSHEYICKYYDTKGNYVGWSLNAGAYKYYDTNGNFVGWSPDAGADYRILDFLTTPLKSTNLDWYFTYSNYKYGLPVSMENSKEKYEVKYTNTGYRLLGYDDKGRIKLEYENTKGDFIDLRTWNTKIPKRGKMIKYSYRSSGTLDTKEYYNESQSYYLREIQLSDGRFSCRGIYENSGEFIDDVLIDVDYGLFSDDEIYRTDPKTGLKTKIAEVPAKQLKKWMLDYLYRLN